MPALLLVHDDPDILDWLTTLLEANGYEVAIGATAFAARAKLERTEVSAVLAGLDVGGGAGHALIGWARDERPDLLERFLVLAEDDADRALAAHQNMTAVSPTEYSSILKWLTDVLAAGPPTPVADFECEAASQTTILLIEDDPHQTRLIEDILRGYGFAIESFTTLEEGQRRIGDASRVPIDVVLSDWYLEGTDGEALYLWLQSEHPDLIPRCIFISGGSMREIREKAPLASCYPKGQDSRVLIAALTRAARLAL